MLDEYSIEQRATQIFDARIKEYFSEVLSLNRPGFLGAAQERNIAWMWVGKALPLAVADS